MPNQVTSAGLETATQAEYITQFTTAMQAIYGADINLDPSTPDGQMMVIYIQAVLDVLDLLTQVYNMFDPDNAIGTILDQRVAINGIQRQAGTNTITDVTITVDQALNIYGLEQTNQPIYTVADNAGNEFELSNSHSFSGAGSTALQFQAKVAGAVLTTPNTITVPITVVLGVTTINNPDTYITLGINEETDAQLRLRRQQSVSFSSQGYLTSLLAALENITTVNSAYVYENVTGSTDGDGVPGHSIWVIVSGGTAADVAEAIYKKRNAGCGMFGAQTYTITQVDGSPFVVKWDNVSSESLFIKFDATSLDGVNPPNTVAILAQLPTLFIPGVYEKVNINDLATLVQEIDPNTLVTNAGFSTTLMGSYTSTLTPTAKNYQFSVTSGNTHITVV